MTESKSKTPGGSSRSVNFHALETEAGYLDALFLTTTGEAEATVKRERPTKNMPASHSKEIVKQLIDFIKAL